MRDCRDANNKDKCLMDICKAKIIVFRGATAGNFQTSFICLSPFNCFINS